MNKKFFYGMFAAGMLFATSCSNDELNLVQSGNEAQVTFSLGLEGGIGSRTISDGSGANKLVYAVFDENGIRIDGINQETVNNVDFPYNATMTLAKGQEYTVVFWAQNSACSSYTIDDDMNVTVNYEGYNNDENRDAFFKAETFTVKGNQEIGVVLKRPFAQINVGVDQQDWEDALASNIEIENSSVVIEEAATKIDLLTGNVSVPVTVEYDLATIPYQFTTSQTLEVETDATRDGKEQYVWLSMSYILPYDASEGGAAKTTVESLSYTFDPENTSKKDILFNEGLNGVPVRRNWRTNILGKILTGDIQFNISILPIYDGDYNEPTFDENNQLVVSTAEDLKKALANEQIDKIALAPGTYSGIFEFDSNREVTIEPAANGRAANDVIIDGEFGVAGSGTVNFKNLTFQCTDFSQVYSNSHLNRGGKYIISIYVGNVNVDNCIFNITEDGSGAIHQYESNHTKLVVKNSTFNSNGNYTLRTKGTVSVENCTFDSMVRQCLQVQGNPSYTDNQTIEFTNNKITNPQDGVMGVSISNGFEARGMTFNVGGNDDMINNISYDPAKNSNILPYLDTHTFTGEIKEIVEEGYAVNHIAATEDQLNALLADPSVTEITLSADINAHIVMKSNKTIDGNGYLLGIINLKGADNVTLKNIKFDAANAVYGYDGVGTKKDYAFSNIITGDNNEINNKGSHNLVIDGCTFTGTFANPGAAISFTDQKRGGGGSGNITIKNCMFDNTNSNYVIYGHYTGDSSNGHGNFVIENNTFKTTCNVGPIYLGRYASNVAVVVTGNDFQSVTSIDDAIYVQDHSSYGVSVNASNNTFNN